MVISVLVGSEGGSLDVVTVIDLKGILWVDILRKILGIGIFLVFRDGFIVVLETIGIEAGKTKVEDEGTVEEPDLLKDIF